MEWHFPLYLGVVAIEKRAFRSPSNRVANIIIITIYGKYFTETRKKNNIFDIGTMKVENYLNIAFIFGDYGKQVA